MTYEKVNCAVCGKEIELTLYEDYIYWRKWRGKNYYFCGYNCRGKWEKTIHDGRRRTKGANNESV